MEMGYTLHIGILEFSMKALVSTASYRLDTCPK
jgi:hypothetical protein